MPGYRAPYGLLYFTRTYTHMPGGYSNQEYSAVEYFLTEEARQPHMIRTHRHRGRVEELERSGGEERKADHRQYSVFYSAKHGLCKGNWNRNSMEVMNITSDD